MVPPYFQGPFVSKKIMVVLTTIIQNTLVKLNAIQRNINKMDGINDNSGDSDTQPIILPLTLLLLLQQRCRRTSTPSNRRWTGQEVVDNLLSCGNPTRIYNQLRMKLDTFFQLRDWLVVNTGLKSSRNISIEEKLLTFMYIASTGASNRAAQERFNRGARAVSRYVLFYLFILYITVDL